MAANGIDEELRLKIAHLRTVIRRAVVLARNIVRTNSKDTELWREDVQMLAVELENSQEPSEREAYAWEVKQDGQTFLVSAKEFTRRSFDRGAFKPLFE